MRDILRALMEPSVVKRKALLWGHLFVTLPAVAAIGMALFFCKYLFYLFTPSWPFYLMIGATLGYEWYSIAMPYWRSAMAKRGFTVSEVEEIALEGGLMLPGAPSIGLFALHCTAAALCGIYLGPRVAGYFAHWILPLLGEPAPTSSLSFHLQYFEVASILPALLVGFAIAGRFPKFSTWAWLMPTLVILYKLLTFAEPNVSVLAPGRSLERFSYYFVIQRVSPAPSFRAASFDPVRLLQQITVVATFYSGVAYSLGALAAKRMWLQRIWESLSREPEPDVIQPEESGIVVIPSDLAEKPLEE